MGNPVPELPRCRAPAARAGGTTAIVQRPVAQLPALAHRPSQAPLPPEPLRHVPLQPLRARVVLGARRLSKLQSIEWVVAATIREVILESLAHDEPMVGRHAHIALVEESMDVAAEQKPVRDLVRSTVWPPLGARGSRPTRGGRRGRLLRGVGAGGSPLHHARPEPRCRRSRRAIRGSGRWSVLTEALE